MPLIEANRLTVTIPAGPDDPPSSADATARIGRWLEGQYGYRPPVERLEQRGWSARWVVAGEAAAGWRYEAVIPRHLGPARAEPASRRPRSRPDHPAGRGREAAATRRPARGAAPSVPLPGLA